MFVVSYETEVLKLFELKPGRNDVQAFHTRASFDRSVRQSILFVTLTHFIDLIFIISKIIIFSWLFYFKIIYEVNYNI